MLCGEGMHRAVYMCVCACVLVGNSIRDGTGRGYPCDSQQVERLWIKGHMHLLCCYRRVDRQVWHVFLTHLPP